MANYHPTGLGRAPSSNEVMPNQDTEIRSRLPDDLVKLTVTVPFAVIESAVRIARTAGCNATGIDVIREVLVSQLCETGFREGSFTDRCTAPLDQVDIDRVQVDAWPNGEVRVD